MTDSQKPKTDLLKQDFEKLHPAIKSSLFKLIAVYECDIDVGENPYPCRIELFQSASNVKLFRARVWEIELCRITPRLPQSPSGKPLHVSDDLLLLERTGRLSRRYDSIQARDPREALQVVFKDLIAKLEEWTGELAKPASRRRRRNRVRAPATKNPRKPKRGSQVILTKLPPGFTDDLPLSDQKAILRIVGKPVQFVGFTRDGRAELEFVDDEEVIHFIYVKPEFITLA